jgi:hypothetical protein
MKNTIALICGVILISAATVASAAISEQDVDRLGKDLTPVGAEKAGNADGTIPEWTGGFTEIFPGWPNDNFYRPNPFADDKILFTITKDNMNQYADKLPEAAKAMLTAYPDFFKMNVYPTRRTAAYPQWYYDNIKKNAPTAKLINDGNGVDCEWGAIPFPVPQNGNEVIWNHLLRFRGMAMESKSGENIVYTSGARIDLEGDAVIHMTFYDPNVSDKDKKAGVIWKYALTLTAPARDSGEGTLAMDNIDPAGKPRSAWTYDPGERRVRRAPNLAFDTPDRPLNVIDDFDVFSGSPERYDWKLIGKKEMYIPYNNNEANSPNRGLKETLVPGFIPADILRYELHRVWVVEATLKEGKRHVYAKRVFYIDEDTWTIMVSDKYDGNGNLWRVAFSYPVHAPEVPLVGRGAVVHVDLKTNGYYVFPHTIGKNRKGWNYEIEPPPASFFTPAAVRRRGR